MRFLGNLSINKKLTLLTLLVSGLVLLLACAVTMTYETVAAKRAATVELGTFANVIAESSSGAVASRDVDSVLRILVPLKENPQIGAAAIYTADGKLLASYGRGETQVAKLPLEAPAEGDKFSAGILEVTRKIAMGAEKVGTVHLRSSVQVYRSHLRSFAFIIAGAVLVCALLALLVSAKFHKTISAPIIELARVAQDITQRKVYSLRAVKRSGDEIGLLADALNHMLSCIQEREAALRSASEELQVQITGRQQTDEALREAEARKAAILETALDCIISIDHEGRIVDFNPAAERTFGYSRAEVVGKEMAQLIIPPALREQHRKSMARYLATGESRILGTRVEMTAMRADRSEFPAELTVNVIRVKGRPMFTAYLRDITERKRAWSAMSESEQRFRATFEQAAAGIAHVGPDERWLRINQKLSEIVGYHPRELLGRAFRDVAHPEDRQDITTCLRRMLDGETQARCLEKRFMRKDGTAVWVSLTLSLAREPNGKPKYFILVVQDISAQKQAEEQIQKNTKLLRLLVESAVAANEAASFEEAARFVLDRVCDYTGWPVGHVYVRATDSSDELVPTKVWHLEDPERFETLRKVTEATKFRRAEGVIGRVSATGKPAWIKDVTNDPDFIRAKLAEDIGVKACLAFPVLVGTEVAAVLEFFSEKALEPDQPLPEVMIHIGTLLGRVIERERAIATVSHLAAIVQSTDDAIVTYSLDGIIESWNASAERIYGYSAEEIKGRPISMVLPPERCNEIAHILEKIKRGERVAPYETERVRKDGQRIHISLTVSPLKDAAGKVTGASAIARDITQRKETERAMRESEERYRKLFHAVPAGIGIADPNGMLIAANEAMQQLMGCSAEELTKLNLADLHANPDGHRKLLETLRQRATLRDHESKLKRKDGTIFDALLNVDQLELGGQKMFLIALRDVSITKQAEERIRRLNRTHAILSNVNQAITRIREPLTLLQEVCHIIVKDGGFPLAWIGLVDEQTKQMKVAAHEGVIEDLLDKLGAMAKDGPHCPGPADRAVREGKSVVCNDVEHDNLAAPWREEALRLGCRSMAAFPLKTAETVRGALVIYASEPHFFDSGEVVLLEELALDLSFAMEHAESEARQAQSTEVLQESRNLLQHIVDSSSSLIYMVDLEGRFLLVNSRLESLLSVPRDKLIGKRRDEVLPRQIADEHRKNDLEVIKKRKPLTLEEQNIEPDGPHFYLSFKFPIFDTKGNLYGVGGISTDITERKRMEEELRFQKMLLESQNEASLDGILNVDESGKMIWFNRRFVEMWGIPAAVVESRSDGAALQSVLDKVVEPEVFLSKVKYLYEHKDMKSRDEILLKDGRVFDRYSSPVVGADGKYLGRVWLFRDVTPQKQAEQRLRDTQLQLFQAEKMETVGRLAASVAHEIKNPLSIATMGLDYLAGSLKPDDENAAAAMQDIRQAIRRADFVLRGLLDFSFPTQLDLKLLELNPIIEQSIAFVGYALRRNRITAEADLGRDLPMMWLDAIRIEQVFVNLFMNAIDAMPNGGKIQVRTYSRQTGPSGIEIVAEVNDTGAGFPQDQLTKVFDPFFSTKGVAKGTGLGLTVAKQIVELHKGTLQVANRPEGGARVTITFKQGGTAHEKENPRR